MQRSRSSDRDGCMRGPCAPTQSERRARASAPGFRVLAAAFAWAPRRARRGDGVRRCWDQRDHLAVLLAASLRVHLRPEPTLSHSGPSFREVSARARQCGRTYTLGGGPAVSGSFDRFGQRCQGALVSRQQHENQIRPSSLTRPASPRLGPPCPEKDIGPLAPDPLVCRPSPHIRAGYFKPSASNASRPLRLDPRTMSATARSGTHQGVWAGSSGNAAH